jgi:hypothetical protein
LAMLKILFSSCFNAVDRHFYACLAFIYWFCRERIGKLLKKDYFQLINEN